MAVNYDVKLAGAEKVCQYIGGSGSLTDLYLSLTFGGGATVEYAGDMAAIVYDATLSKGVQIGGYDYFTQGISYVGPWPEEWQTSVAGTYTATISDLAQYGIAGDGFYYFCLLNGWKYAAKTQYAGTASMIGLTNNCNIQPPNPTVKPSAAPSISLAPTVAQITDVTTNAGTLHLDFDFAAVGKEQFCKTVYASGAITNIESTFTFTPSQTDSYASDLYVTVQSAHTDSCIQVGGYDVSLCESVFAWPTNFGTSSPGDYTANVPVSSADYTNPGYASYKVCYGNGYTESKSVSYNGNSYFTGLTENYNRQYVTQTSVIGEVAEVAFDVVEPGSGSICGTITGANGKINYVNTSIYFDPMSTDPYVDSYASDMFITVTARDVNKNVLKCVQFGGYDYISTGCTKSGLWPAGWEVNKEGNYKFNAYVGETDVSGSNSWTVCVGNGYKASDESTYQGTALLVGLSTTANAVTVAPTRAPTNKPSVSKKPTSTPVVPAPTKYPTRKPSVAPTRTFKPTSETIQVTSSNGGSLTFSYDAVLAGTQKVCTYFGADKQLNAINAVLNFPGADTVEYPGDMGVVVYSPDLSKGVQVGGYDYYINSVSYVSPWPASWQSTAPGTYNATIDVSSYGLKGSGFYYLCIFNGWQYASKIEYKGTGELKGLTYNSALVPPAPTARPTVKPTVTYAPTKAAVESDSAVGATLDVRFDVSLSGGQQKCASVGATGHVTNVDASYTFTPTGTDSYASDLYITIKSDQVDSCLQLGGYNIKMCGSATTNYYKWPDTFSTTKAGSYSANVNIANTLYANTLTGNYTVCYGNGYTTSAVASFSGHSSFPALTTVDVYPSSDCAETVSVSFDTVLNGKTASCTDLGARGSLTQVHMTLNFGGSSGGEYASDMGLAIFNNISKLGLQVGGDDYIIPQTMKAGSWPASWDTAAAGTYKATVDVTAADFGGMGNYRVCIVNGLNIAGSVSYQGTTTLSTLTRKCGAAYTGKPSFAPSSAPTPPDSATDTSSTSGAVTFDYNLNLEGTEEVCRFVKATGAITEVGASLLFSPSPSDPNTQSYASDFYITISAPGVSSCIQVGGYDVNVCANPYSWPKSWDNTAKNTYGARVAVSNSDFAKLGKTNYTVCFGNGLMVSNNVGYSGNAELTGLTDVLVKSSSDDSNNNSSNTAVAVAIPLVLLLAAGLGAYWYFYCRSSKPASSGAKANLASPYAAYEDHDAVVPRTTRDTVAEGSTINNPLLQKG